MNNQNNNFNSEEAFDLFEKSINGELTQSEGERLDALVFEDSDARAAYLDYAHLHTSLHWDGVSAMESENRELIRSMETVSRTNKISLANKWSTVALAGLVLLTVGYFGGTLLNNSKNSASTDNIATLIETKSCTWGASDFPTEIDSQFGKGTLNLVSGLATLKFSSGAEVTIEAPATMELINPMKCVLHDGTLVANVPEQAKGFVVDTKSAHLVDQGTEFGVTVDSKKGTTDVQVFDGIVDVEHTKSLKKQRMTTGQRSILNQQQFVSIEAELDETEFEPDTALNSFENAISISTRDGAGQDGSVLLKKSDQKISRRLLLVKNSTAKPQHSRKAYLSFDLTSLSKKQIINSKLQLQILKAKYGFASLTPDATFAVYGITDENLDSWNDKQLTWENAPANLDEGSKVDESKAKLLGRFVIPQGVFSGFATIHGKPLSDFLNSDSNRIVSLIVVCETAESKRGGIVHAFAGRRQPESVPPTLFIEQEE